MRYDLVVVGSGIAGLFAALSAFERGARNVVVVTKGRLQDSATQWAQGGIAAALDEADSPELHEDDTLAAGAGLCDEEAVHVLVTDGVERVTDLIRFGVRFDLENGQLAYAREAAHSMARVLHAGGDATGKHIELALIAAIRARPIDVRENAFVSRLVVEGGACRGVELLDGSVLESAAVVLATGGAGQLFTRTTNPLVSTGDGVALALRTGAAVADLEFFQFHPTAFAPAASHRGAVWRFLVSEAVRGHGAILRNQRGEAFMTRYDARAELAPRDVVARAIVDEMRVQGIPNVWLDATGFPAGEFAERFPTIDAYCRNQGCDPERDAIPVAPAAHYMMGGVWTDTWGRTTVPGLYACGEVASTGVHGANRLASNSLLEGVVFGSRVAQCMTDPACATATAANVAIGRGARYPGPAPLQTFALQLSHRPVAMLPVRETLQTVLWDQVGIRRDGSGLAEARERLATWATATPVASVDSLETWNLALVGWVMAEAALRREESRGAHARADFPEPRAEWRLRQAFTVGAALGGVPLEQRTAVAVGRRL